MCNTMTPIGKKDGREFFKLFLIFDRNIGGKVKRGRDWCWHRMLFKQQYIIPLCAQGD